MAMATYVEIVQLVLAAAPHRVAQVVAFADDPQGFVRVVVVQVHLVLAFGHDDAPHLDVDVLLTVGCGFRHGDECQWHRFAVEVASGGSAGDLEESGGEVGVRCDDLGCMSFGYTGSSDEEGDVDVFFVRALLAGLKAVLAHVIAVVRGKYQIRVFHDTVMIEPCRQAGHHLVDRLERSKAVSIPLVVVVDVRLVLLCQLRDPGCAAGLCDVSKLLRLGATVRVKYRVWVEGCIARDFDILEQMLVPISWHRRGLSR